MTLTVVDTETFADAAFSYNAMLNTDRVLNFYFSLSTFDYRGHVLSWDGSVISDGSETVLSDLVDSVIMGQAAKPGVEKALLLRGRSSVAYVHVVTISGDTVIFNAGVAVESVGFFASQAAISGNSTGTLGLCAYRQSGGGDPVRLCRFTISGTTITPGTPQDHSLGADLQPVDMIPIDANRVGFLFYHSSSNEWAMQVIDISSGISEGTVEDLGLGFDTWVPQPGTLASPDSTHLVASARRGAAVELIAASISDTTLTLGLAVQVEVATSAAAAVDAQGNVGTFVWQLSNDDQKVETLTLTGTVIVMNGDTITLPTGAGTREETHASMIRSGAVMIVYDAVGDDGEVVVLGGVPATSPSSDPGQFYFGQGTLVEKFTLPFSGIAPKGMTLDKSLGTIVIGSKIGAAVPIVYSQHPYPTGTATSEAFPTGTSISAVRWI